MQHRSAERHQTDQQAQLRPACDSDGLEPIAVTVRDISTGGVMMHLDQALTSATVWQLSIDGQPGIGGVLTVRWCAPRKEGGFAAGGQFVQGQHMLSALGIDETVASQPTTSTPHLLATHDLNVSAITDATVEAWRALRVGRTVQRCTLDVNDSLTVGESISGGVTYCGTGVSADRIGSADGEQTIIHLGRAQSLAVMLEQADEYLPVIEQRIAQVQSDLDAIAEKGKDRDHEDREQELILTMQRDDMITRRDRVQSNRDNLRAWPERKWRPRLEVAIAIHAGTVVVIANCQYEIGEDLDGPLVICVADDGTPIIERDGTTTPLADRCEPASRAA